MNNFNDLNTKKDKNVDIAEQPKHRILSLCTGYGGLDQGVERVLGELRTVAYVEIEAYAIASLISKMEAGRLAPAPVWPDLKTFPGESFCGCVDILTAGYPCQPFSAAGKRGGEDDPRHLFPYIERIIEAVRPVLCFFENVSGHISLGLPQVYESLRNLGYSVEVGIFTAEEVGAPHKRERVFIMAYTRYQKQSGWEYFTEKNNKQRKIRIPKRGKPSPCNREFDRKGYLRKEGDVGHTSRISSDGERQVGERGQEPTRGSGGELADAERKGLEGSERPQSFQGEGTPPHGPASQYGVHPWPARPGQPQHGFEPPRTTPTSQIFNLLIRNLQEHPASLSPWEHQRFADYVNFYGVETQPGLGRVPHGPPDWVDADRVDRLRACGNGVVPQVAELAFRTLLAKFEQL